jgi:hypothetical protein
MYPTFSLKIYTRELFRPWKIVTFSIALGYYIWGAYRYKCPTWDVPVSIIMSVLTYLFAPWTVKSIYYLIQRRPKYWIPKLIICAIVIYACASGSYELYNWWHLGYHPPPTYWVNLYYSSLIFFAAGMLWRFEGTLKELLINLKNDILRIFIHAKKI